MLITLYNLGMALVLIFVGMCAIGALIAIVNLFFDYKYVRVYQQACIAAMQGLLADPEERSDERKPMESCEEATARLAVAHAKALMKEMGKK